MLVQLLKAQHGDAIVIKTNSDGHDFIIVVDGGPRGVAEDIADYYQELGKIDLMVLTHFDEDHISGLISYFRRLKDGQIPVTHFWGNCAQGIDFQQDTTASDASMRNANTLASFLRAQGKKDASFEWREDICVPFGCYERDLEIDVLAPSRKVLEQLKAEYEEYLKSHPMTDETEETTQIASVRVKRDEKMTIDELAATDEPRRLNLLNRSSIAFLLTAEGKRVLMLGDADADIVADNLECMYRDILPLDVDLVKVAHHGSLNNVSKRLLSLIRCNKFAISTNGGTSRSYHPDRKTLALILRYANRKSEEPITFYFNYPLAKIEERTGNLLKCEELDMEKCIINDNQVNIIL